MSASLELAFKLRENVKFLDFVFCCVTLHTIKGNQKCHICVLFLTFIQNITYYL